MSGLLLFDVVSALLFVVVCGIPVVATCTFHCRFVASLGAWQWFVVPAEFLCGLVVMLLVVAALRRLLPRLEPGRYPFPNHKQAIVWSVAFALQRIVYLPVWHALLFGFASLRWLTIWALGGRASFRMRSASTTSLLDAALLRIEEDTMVAAEATVCGHLIDKGQITLGNVHLKRGAEVFGWAFVGPGCMIGELSIVGFHSILTANVTIGDDVRIGTRCFLAPGVRIESGAVIGHYVVIEANVLIGPGAKIKPGAVIPKGHIVGPGEVYPKDA